MEDFLKNSSAMGDLGGLVQLKDALPSARTMVCKCHVQFVEAGIVYALRNLRSAKQAKTEKSDKKKDKAHMEKSMKSVLEDMNTRIVSGEFGIRNHMVNQHLRDEMSQCL